MSPILLLYPVFALIGLTFGLLYWMGRVRVASVKSGKVKISDIALGQDVWPDKIQQVGNCFHNQFELPVLFYALVGFVMLTKQSDIMMLGLAWLFAVLRYAHAYVHTGSNHLPSRFNVYATGMAVLVIMWVWFAIKITVMSF
jgi:hypothetical protein